MRVSFILNRLSTLTLCAAATLALTACEQSPTQQAEASDTKIDYAALLETVNEELAQNPADAALNAQNIVARIGVCIAEDCFSQNKGEQSFQQVITPLQNSFTFMKNQEEALQTTYAYTHELEKALVCLKTLPEPLTAHQKLMKLQAPQAFKQTVQSSFFITLEKMLTTALSSADNTTLMRQMQNISAGRAFPPAPQAMVEFLTGLMSNNQPLIHSKTLAVRAQGGDHIPAKAWELLPAAYLFYQTQQEPKVEAGERFLATFSTFIQERKWPESSLTTQARASIAQGLENLLKQQESTSILTQGSKSPAQQVAQISPISAAPTPQMEAETLEQHGEETTKPASQATPAPTRLTLYLKRMELELTGKNASEQEWETFLKEAATFIQHKKTAAFILPITIDMVPEAQHGRYRNALFTALGIANEKNEDITPILTHFEGQEIEKNTQIRLEKSIRAAIENAIVQKDVEKLLTYSARNPNIAKSLRQNVVPLLVDAFKNAFLTEEFSKLEQLQHTLIHTLAVDLNLERILLQTYDTYLKDEKIALQLSSESVENLLQPQEEIAYDLGAKFTFLKENFTQKQTTTTETDSTDIINNILKGLVLNSSGKYGTPNALYRLNHAFNETDFTQEERDSYLISAIRTAMERDLDLTAENVIILGEKLLQQHENLSSSFILNEALARVESIEDNKALWRLLKQEQYAQLKQTMQEEQADYISLMEGVIAYEREDFASAIDAFSRITQPYYKQLAEPFASHYVKDRESFQGVYVSAPLVNNTSPIATLIIGTPHGSTPISGTLPNLDTLTNVYVSLINRIGTSQHQQNMLTSQGSVARENYSGALNFTKYTVELKTPTSLNTERFGNIYSLQRTSNGNIRLRPHKNGNSITLQKIAKNPSYSFLPNGRYSITTQIKGQTENTQHMFPTGAQLRISTNPSATVIAGTNIAVHPIQGNFTHPAQPDIKQPFTGVYNPKTHLTSLQFKYLLPAEENTPEQDSTAEANEAPKTPAAPAKKQTVTAYARCQFFKENMLCAGHNAHNLRLQYHHLVQGKRVE